jgi:DNA processing protein
MSPKEACLALSLLPNLGPVRLRQLVARFGSPEGVLRAGRESLRAVPGIDAKLAEVIADWENQIDLAGEWRKVRERGLTLLTQEDDLYPELLRKESGAPFLLYVWGRLERRDHNAVGVVGSRQATVYGLSAAKRLSFQIAYAGYTVVSGLARGIDTAAHEAALAAKGRTIAVIGSGIGQLYPPENAPLAERIAANGAVVSEYPVDRIADRQTFPYRNRIVAGWCGGLLVVEAPGRSGALITAQNALDAGRSVYAVPGPIDRPNSLGCHRLIQQGAKLVVDGADVIEDMTPLFPMAPQGPAARAGAEAARPAAVSLTLDEQILFDALEGGEAHVDELIGSSGLTAPTVSAGLIRLEMRGLVKQLPGRRYMRAG